MNKENKKLLKAVKRIKKECRKHDNNCTDCPFLLNDDCMFFHSIPKKYDTKLFKEVNGGKSEKRSSCK